MCLFCIVNGADDIVVVEHIFADLAYIQWHAAKTKVCVTLSLLMGSYTPYTHKMYSLDAHTWYNDDREAAMATTDNTRIRFKIFMNFPKKSV